MPQQPSFSELVLIWGWESDVRRGDRATRKAEGGSKGKRERKKQGGMEREFVMDLAVPCVASSHLTDKIHVMS